MRNYYPIDDMEEIDLCFLLKRWRANQLFPNLLIIEILEVLAFTVIEKRPLTYSYFHNADSLTNFRDGQRNNAKFKEGEYYISIYGFHKMEGPDVQEHHHYYHAWGDIHCEEDDSDISQNNIGFNSLLIDDIFVLKADVIAFELSNFESNSMANETNKETNKEINKEKIIAQRIINVIAPHLKKKYTKIHCITCIKHHLKNSNNLDELEKELKGYYPENEKNSNGVRKVDDPLHKAGFDKGSKGRHKRIPLI